MDRLLFVPVLVSLVVGSAACSGPAIQPAATKPAQRAEPVADSLVANPMLPPRAYTDRLGIVVEIVPLKISDGASPQALVRVTGIANYIAGVTFLSTRQKSPDVRGSDYYWTTQLNGVTTRIVHTNRAMDHDDKIAIFLPRSVTKTTLQFDEIATRAIEIPELIADYRSHLADGSLARLRAFDREYEVQARRESLARKQEALAKSCGGSIDVQMDWDKVQSKEDFKEVRFCDVAVEGLAKICNYTRSAGREVLSKIGTLSCELHQDLRLDYNDKERVLTVHAATSNLVSTGKAVRLISKEIGLKPTLLKSSKGVYVVLSTHHDSKEDVYAGVGTKLYKQHWSPDANLTAFSLWSGAKNSMARNTEPGKWSIKCPQGLLEFDEVEGKERDHVLSTSSFEDTVWKRQMYALARDARGIYYYVDRLKDQFGGLDYRVFKGPRGRVALTTMIDIVSDSEGMIFSTTSGSLRLVLSNKRPAGAKWKKGKRSEELVVVPDRTARPLVFNELGVYDGEELGTVCSF